MNDSQDPSFQIESSIPVLRMLDEAKAKAFYLDFLGYAIDWEHRFRADSPDSPLYLQVSKGASVFHLNGHANEDAPVTEVRIPVRGVEAFSEWLGHRVEGGEKPEVVDPRYEGRKTDMNLYDPSGNLLTFWEPKANVG